MVASGFGSNKGTKYNGIIRIGAGHVISVKEMLKQVYPELQVKLMYD